MSKADRRRQAMDAAAQGKRTFNSIPVRPVAQINRMPALAVGIIGYLILLFGSPYRWTVPLWAFLALLLVPALIGLLIGNKGLVRLTAWTSGRIAFYLMFFYAAMGMMKAHAHVNSGGAAGATFLAGLFVAVVYAGVAGGVAAGVNGMLGARQNRERAAS